MGKLFFISGLEDSLDSEDEDATPTITKTSKPLPLQTKKWADTRSAPTN